MTASRRVRKAVLLAMLVGIGGCFECYNPGDVATGSGFEETTGFEQGDHCDFEAEVAGRWCDGECRPATSIDNCGTCGTVCQIQKLIDDQGYVVTVGGCSELGYGHCTPILEGCFEVGTMASADAPETACDEGIFTGEFATCQEYCLSIGKNNVTYPDHSACGPGVPFSGQLYDSPDDCVAFDHDACDPLPDSSGLGTEHLDPSTCEAFSTGTAIAEPDQCLATAGQPARWARCCCPYQE